MQGQAEGAGNLRTRPQRSNSIRHRSRSSTMAEPLTRSIHRSWRVGSDAHTRPAEPPLRDRWLRDKHPAMAPKEAEAVASLLQQILQYDPAERPSTTDLLGTRG